MPCYTVYLLLLLVLVNLSCSRISGTDRRLHRVESNKWGRKILKKPVVDRITNRDKDDIVDKEGFRGLSLSLKKSLTSGRLQESGESKSAEEPVIDPSLIYPTRRPRFDGRIAFPPVLPMIHGQDRSLPFGTAQMSARSTSRRKSRGKFRKQTRSSNL